MICPLDVLGLHAPIEALAGLAWLAAAAWVYVRDRWPW